MRRSMLDVIETAIFLITISQVDARSILPRVLGIDNNPAPSPEDGPPLSANASRNKDLLPGQVGEIIGAYVFVLILVAIGLWVAGRKRRHQVRLSNTQKPLDIEMVEPTRKLYAIDTTPISPGIQVPSHTRNGSRNFSWPSPDKKEPNPYVFPSNNNHSRNPSNIDPVVEADREMLQRDLEDIYAHVMEQEEAKAKGVSPREMAPPTALQNAGPAPRRESTATTSSKKTEKQRPGKLDIENQSVKSGSRGSRASSIISSIMSPKKKTFRGMKISSPMATGRSGYSDDEPLSPRYDFVPGPPPPVPEQSTYSHTRNTSDSARSPTHTNDSFYRSGYHRQQAHLSQVSQQSSDSQDDPPSAISATSQTPLYPTSNSRAPTSAPGLERPKLEVIRSESVSSSPRALPFRQFEDASVRSPSSFAPSTRTTVLERSSAANGPRTGGLTTGGTPWSPGAVPYSPYQPMTPMMPMTPRLVTKEERKAKKKAVPRTPVAELIKSDDELWDSGY